MTTQRQRFLHLLEHANSQDQLLRDVTRDSQRKLRKLETAQRDGDRLRRRARGVVSVPPNPVFSKSNQWRSISVDDAGRIRIGESVPASTQLERMRADIKASKAANPATKRGQWGPAVTSAVRQIQTRIRRALARSREATVDSDIPSIHQRADAQVGQLLLKVNLLPPDTPRGEKRLAEVVRSRLNRSTPIQRRRS